MITDFVNPDTKRSDQWLIARSIRANPTATVDNLVAATLLPYWRVVFLCEEMLNNGELIEVGGALCVTSAIGKGL